MGRFQYLIAVTAAKATLLSLRRKNYPTFGGYGYFFQQKSNTLDLFKAIF